MPYPGDVTEADPQPDHDVIIAALQDQIDDLAAAVSAQQATIETMLARVAELERAGGGPPAT